MELRFPAHLEVASMIRLVQDEGGFATVLKKGERDAGTILFVLTENGANARIYERMPQLDGTRKWTLAMAQDAEKPQNTSEYLDRRGSQDPDLWIVELDIADGERFIDLIDGMG